MKIAITPVKKSPGAIQFDCPECSARRSRRKTQPRKLFQDGGCRYVAGPGPYCARHQALVDAGLTGKRRRA